MAPIDKWDKTKPIVNFSLRKEVFFIAMGSLIGAGIMIIPSTLNSTLSGTSDLFWLAAANLVNSMNYQIGILIHILVAIIIGIVTGLIFYKIHFLDISKIRNGIIFGLLAGTIVEIIFTIPVYQFLLGPNMALLQLESEIKQSQPIIQQIANGFFIHWIWGVILGITASILTIKFGANYRCHSCDIEFTRFETLEKHKNNMHDADSEATHIVILGGGYAGVGVLNRLQKIFQHNIKINISLISESNFFLHTPMLPEMATGIIEPRHIATPIRKFCKRARFYQTSVVGIDLDKHEITTKRNEAFKLLHYDYLVLAMGSETKFWNDNVKKYSLTIKTLSDALRIRNHIISKLEDADQENQQELQTRMLTFVVVGGGFSGVEMVGELNHFVRDAVQKYYKNINPKNINVILVSAIDGILPEIGKLGVYAKQALEHAGVKIIINTKLTDAQPNYVTLSNDEKIYCNTLIWAGGNTVNNAIEQLNTQHHKNKRLIVDQYLRLPEYKEVFALGDCAMVVDPRNNTPYPPTAQHAIRQAKVVSDNLSTMINDSDALNEFIYDTQGTMAKLGGKEGVALVMGHEYKGIIAWFMWKHYYLSTLPILEKKIRVGLDWAIDLFFPRDVTHLYGLR